MLYRARVNVCKFLQASNRWDIWHGEVPVCYHYSIKSLFPPIVELLPALAEHKSPFLAILLGKLYRSVVLHKVLVASSVDQILDILPDHLVRAERRIVAVQGDGVIRTLGWNWLL